MNLFLLLIVVFFSSLILTMIGLGGWLIFSPLFVLLSFPKSMAVSASLFLNGIVAASAATVYLRKRMVDFSVSVPLNIASSLGAPVGAFTTYWVNLKAFMGIMASVIFLAALRILFSKQVEGQSGKASRRGRSFCGAFADLSPESPHGNRSRIFHFYRLLFFPDRICHPCFDKHN